MMAYVTVGVNDMDAAKAFYSAFLPALGYALEEIEGELSFAVQEPPVSFGAPPDFYVKRAFDGQPATPGNGTMIAFQAERQEQVRTLHALAVTAGGRDEGAPGFRAQYGARFYVGYLRDPEGNKIALFASNRDEPGRDD